MPVLGGPERFLLSVKMPIFRRGISLLRNSSLKVLLVMNSDMKCYETDTSYSLSWKKKVSKDRREYGRLRVESKVIYSNPFPELWMEPEFS